MVSLLSAAALGSVCFAEEGKPVSLTPEEVHAKRKQARAELMVPSLDGIRGIAYRVVGYKNSEPYEKQMSAKLEQLRVPLFKAVELKEGQGPVDAVVQISFYKTGNNTIGEMTVTQWTTLMRSPRSQVRAVTYSDKVFLPGHKPEHAIDQLTDQFVMDFLKANQKNTASKSTKKGSLEASGGGSSKKAKAK